MSPTIYRLYDWFRRTRLASLLLFHGKRFETIEKDIWITGRLKFVNTVNLDGDVTFDVETYEGPYHCEITPVTRPDLQDFICYLMSHVVDINARGFRPTVQVFGDKLFDPAHGGDPDKIEIHPVKRAEVL